MLSAQRKIRIKELILQKGSVSVAELSKMFGVSFETIRRDLDALQKEGLVEKSYGGAVLNSNFFQNEVQKLAQTLTFNFTNDGNTLIKIARDQIKSGNCIFLDSSINSINLAGTLNTIPLTVITNSLNVLGQLEDFDSIKCYLTGGIYDPLGKIFHGSITNDTIKHFTIEKAFINANAINMRFGVCESSEESADVLKCVIENTEKVYIFVNKDAVDKTSLFKLCSFNLVHAIITDVELPSAWNETLNSYEVVVLNNFDNKNCFG